MLSRDLGTQYGAMPQLVQLQQVGPLDINQGPSLDLQNLIWNPFKRKERDQQKNQEEQVIDYHPIENPLEPAQEHVYIDDQPKPMPTPHIPYPYTPAPSQRDHLQTILEHAKNNGLISVRPQMQNLIWNPFKRKERDEKKNPADEVVDGVVFPEKIEQPDGSTQDVVIVNPTPKVVHQDHLAQILEQAKAHGLIHSRTEPHLQNLFWNPFKRRERDQQKQNVEQIANDVNHVSEQIQDAKQVVIVNPTPQVVHEDHIANILELAKQHGLVADRGQLQNLAAIEPHVWDYGLVEKMRQRQGPAVVSQKLEPHVYDFGLVEKLAQKKQRIAQMANQVENNRFVPQPHAWDFGLTKKVVLI